MSFKTAYFYKICFLNLNEPITSKTKLFIFSSNIVCQNGKKDKNTSTAQSAAGLAARISTIPFRECRTLIFHGLGS